MQPLEVGDGSGSRVDVYSANTVFRFQKAFVQHAYARSVPSGLCVIVCIAIEIGCVRCACSGTIKLSFQSRIDEILDALAVLHVQCSISPGTPKLLKRGSIRFARLTTYKVDIV